MRYTGKPINTPFGSFPNMQAAAEALSIRTQTLTEVIKSEHFPQWTFDNGKKTYKEKVGHE